MIIGFAGKAASGKTTAAKYLQNCLAGETLIIPMATVLREEVEEFLRRIGADEHVSLVYGSQEDKAGSFTSIPARRWPPAASGATLEQNIRRSRMLRRRPP